MLASEFQAEIQDQIDMHGDMVIVIEADGSAPYIVPKTEGDDLIFVVR